MQNERKGADPPELKGERAGWRSGITPEAKVLRERVAPDRDRDRYGHLGQGRSVETRRMAQGASSIEGGWTQVELESEWFQRETGAIVMESRRG
jgi:hypothetical protein